MTLDEWLSSKNLNSESFGRLLKVTGQAVRRYRTGERMPDADTCERIFGLTDGNVTVADIHAARIKWLRAQPAVADAKARA